MTPQHVLYFEALYQWLIVIAAIAGVVLAFIVALFVVAVSRRKQDE